MRPAGVLADFLEVEDRYEHVVEDFLRDELNYIVVKSWDAADEGLRLLRSDVDGRATFLVHPEDSQAKFSFILDEVGQSRPHSDAVVPLKNCIRVLDGFGKSLEVILPKLGNGYIVPDPERRPRSGAGKSRRILPLAVGRVLPQCHRHRRQAAQPRSAVHEARAARRAAARWPNWNAPCARRKPTSPPWPRNRRTYRAAATAGRREARGRAPGHDLGHTLHQLDSEMARVRERLSTYEARIAARGRRACGAREPSSRAQRGELLQHEEKQRSLEDEMQAAQSSLEALRQRRDEAAQLATEARAHVATLEERRRGAHAGRTADRGDAVGSFRSPGQAEGADRIRRRARSSSARRRMFAWPSKWLSGRPSAKLPSSAIANCRTNCRPSASASCELEEALKTAREALDAARDRRGELVGGAGARACPICSTWPKPACRS